MDEDSYEHWSTDTVRWSDTDRIGHVNHLAIGAYFETGRSRFIAELEEPHQTFVTASLTMEFIRELHWPDLVRIGTAVIEVGNTSCKLIQGVFSNGSCVALATTVLVLIDSDTRQPVAIPDQQRSMMGLHALK
ncbi:MULTISPECIES: acyl-CoA thioesterase [Caballeronia]|uniref:Thioesterase n=1 Tax=Caballeronia zhejiangensis TaxID=871203 RepID=A0A656QBH1_9BURK|nr:MULTISPECIES: thioesterase family protein [Caballeronia]KDR25330.1 thioesterase [Caballeronia zhejiangensis]